MQISIIFPFIVKHCKYGGIMDIQTLKHKLDEAHYIYDETLITTLSVALKLGRPLLIEGAAGV